MAKHGGHNKLSLEQKQAQLAGCVLQLLSGEGDRRSKHLFRCSVCRGSSKGLWRRFGTMDSTPATRMGASTLWGIKHQMPTPTEAKGPLSKPRSWSLLLGLR